MRILFLGLTYQEHVEYEIHEWLAQQADPLQYQSTFIRQTAESHPSLFKAVQEPGTVTHYWADFGRNMTIIPRPSHLKRGLMVASNVPARLNFLLQEVRRFRPDFIYTSQQHLDCFYALALRQLTGVPHLLHLHYLPGPWLGKIAYQALRSTPYLIGISEFVKEGAIRSGVRPENLRVIYNGVTRLFEEAHRDPAWLCSTFGLPENSKVIVSAGRLDPEKRHEFTMRAMTQVKARFPEAKLLICGKTQFSPDYEELLKKLAVELGLEKDVVFTGHRTDLPQILASSDIFCLPSVNEAFGMVFIEAMTAGLPVVAVADGGVPEIVRHGETGLLCAPDDVDCLTAYLTQLLENPEAAKKLGQAGKARAQEMFSGQRFYQEWDCVLQDFYRQATTQQQAVV